MDGQFPPQEPASVREARARGGAVAGTATVSSSSQSTGMTGHCPRLLFLPVRLPVRTRDRRTLPAWQVKSLLPGRDRPVTVLPRADGMLG